MLELTESSTVTNPGIDREKGIISNVRILGEKSVHSSGKRKYSATGMRKCIQEGSYDDINVFISHKTGGREFTERFGKLRNSVFEQGQDGPCIKGDLHYNTKHPNTEMILEDIEKFGAGLSHHAYGNEGKNNIVENWNPKSVDLVHNASTNKNLFEENDVPQKALTTILKEHKDSDTGKSLSLMIEEFDVDPEKEEVPVDTDPDVELKSAIANVMKSCVDKFATGEIDLKELMQKFKELAKKMDMDKPSKPKEDKEETPDEKEESMDSKLKVEYAALKESQAKLEEKLAKADAKSTLQESSIEPTDIRISMLTKCESDQDKKALLESWEPQQSSKPNAPRNSPPKNKGNSTSYKELKESTSFFKTKA